MPFAPDAKVKQRWLEEFGKTHNRLSAQQQKTAMYNLFPAWQTDLMAPVADRLLADLVAYDAYRDQKLVTAMVRSIIPQLCSSDNIARLDNRIKDNPQLGLIALKGLKEAPQNEAQCVKLNNGHPVVR